MALSLLEPVPAPPVPGSGVPELIARAERCLSRAGEAPFEALSQEALAEAVWAVARLESRAASVRLALSAEADRRRVAEQTAETGTDAWVARLTGSTREQAAGVCGSRGCWRRSTPPPGRRSPPATCVGTRCG